jgi:hypothetical protein
MKEEETSVPKSIQCLERKIIKKNSDEKLKRPFPGNRCEELEQINKPDS